MTRALRASSTLDVGSVRRLAGGDVMAMAITPLDYPVAPRPPRERSVGLQSHDHGSTRLKGQQQAGGRSQESGKARRGRQVVFTCLRYGVRKVKTATVAVCTGGPSIGCPKVVVS